MKWNQVTIIVSATVLSNITGNLESKLPNPPQENCGPITIGLRHSSSWLPPGCKRMRARSPLTVFRGILVLSSKKFFPILKVEQQVVAEQNGS
ncbi:hypothetical protein TNIN_397381 [Trichonephila inaurata madagascariensis]|uniref:Uncharacterized protein n=1 Tax=Trichonephila inaurata madagascariensis TaxID=2747483 RepID=A0A8X6WR81_9ARAC|nr:hypothetical protein TNIN_397381 [Trichonephila inaurata madagascariensis]